MTQIQSTDGAAPVTHRSSHEPGQTPRLKLDRVPRSRPLLPRPVGELVGVREVHGDVRGGDDEPRLRDVVLVDDISNGHEHRFAHRSGGDCADDRRRRC
jgi:hypothetical protein